MKLSKWDLNRVDFFEIKPSIFERKLQEQYYLSYNTKTKEMKLFCKDIYIMPVNYHNHNLIDVINIIQHHIFKSLN